LIHSLGKIFSKVLACRLTLRLDELVYRSQTTFVKGCFIQDGFKLVQAAAKVLHVRRKDSILLKVDIAWAFDSMSWPFLLEILWHMGFLPHWMDWVSVLLVSASTRVLLNGSPSAKICNGHGL
jgi:hypothetical protein